MNLQQNMIVPILGGDRSQIPCKTPELCTRNRKNILLTGGLIYPVYQKGKGPPMGNSSDFFLAFWDVIGNLMNGTKKNKQE